MRLGPFSRRRGVAFPFCVALAITVEPSCSAPDGGGLYQPFSAAGAITGAGGAIGASAGSGGGGSAGTSAGGGPAGRGGEGQGGNLPLAGAVGPGSSIAGTTGDTEASVPDAGPIDAGSEVDAASPALPEPPPATCQPSDEVCDGLDNDCDDVIDTGAACPEGCSGFTLADHAYMVCAEAVDRAVALARCGDEGMRLAWIETADENSALLATIVELDLAAAGELLVQIGASDAADEDEWSWIGNAASVDGFQFWTGNGADTGGATVGGAHANWANGEPNNTATEDCGAMTVTGSAARAPGQWDDRQCIVPLPFLCEEP